MYMPLNRNTIALIATCRSMANAFLKQELRRHGLAGFVPTHGNIIDALLKKGEMPMHSLAEYIRRDKSTVTALVGKLEQMGFVKRNVSSADNRINLVSLTEKGENLRTVFEGVSNRMFATALDGIPDADVEHLGNTLGRIIDNFARAKTDDE